MSRIFTLLVISIVLVTGACKKDKADTGICGTNWAVAVQDELNAVADAATAYAANQTSETCSAYKSAFQDYLNALEPFLDCTTYTAQQKADLQDAIDQAQAELDTLCDE